MDDPPYRRIAGDIRRRIASGALRPGDRVPSARQITHDWGVAVATATKALATLRREGLTTVHPGIGTVVAAPAAAPRPAPTAHVPDGELSRPRIVRAAIAIADTDGMAELSMRRLAADLGVATMSLYRHVSGKDELVIEMIDEVIGTLPLPAPPPGWRHRLTVAARLLWTAFRRHPWLAPAMGLMRPQLAPRAMHYTEWVLTAFEGSTVPLPERMYVNILMFAFVRGLAMDLEREAAARRDTGMSVDEWMDAQSVTMGTMITDDLPAMRKLTEDDFDFDLDKLFAYGLDRFLDGIAVRLGARAARP